MYRLKLGVREKEREKERNRKRILLAEKTKEEGDERNKRSRENYKKKNNAASRGAIPSSRVHHLPIALCEIDQNHVDDPQTETVVEKVNHIYHDIVKTDETHHLEDGSFNTVIQKIDNQILLRTLKESRSLPGTIRVYGNSEIVSACRRRR